jgi:hypothetical protein
MGAESIPETPHKSNIPQTMKNVQHNISIVEQAINIPKHPVTHPGMYTATASLHSAIYRRYKLSISPC